MNRQRLTALIGATAVLAGVLGVLGGGAERMPMSRSWADVPAVSQSVQVEAAAPTKGRTAFSRTWS